MLHKASTLKKADLQDRIPITEVKDKSILDPPSLLVLKMNQTQSFIENWISFG